MVYFIVFSGLGQVLQLVEPGEDTARTFYNEARLYMKILSCTPRYDQCRRIALQRFDTVCRYIYVLRTLVHSKIYL